MELHIFCDVFSEPEDYKGTCRGRRTQVKKKGSKFAKETQIEKSGNGFHVSQFFISCSTECNILFPFFKHLCDHSYESSLIKQSIL